MNTYKCRYTRPYPTDWFEVKQQTPGEAANQFHFETGGGVSIRDGKWTVYYIIVEVEGHGEFISRVYHTGIYRLGQEKKTTLEDVASILGVSVERLQQDFDYDEGKEI